MQSRKPQDNSKQLEQTNEPPLYSLPVEMLDHISSYLSLAKDKVHFALTSFCLHTFFIKQDLKQQAYIHLQQAVVDDDKKTVKKILDVRPELLLEKPAKKIAVESKYTWQTFYVEEPLIMALVKHQPSMLALLLPYFKVLEERGLVKDGKATALSQWNQAETYLCKQAQTSGVELIQQLLNVIITEKFTRGSPQDKLIDRISKETKDVLSAFKQTFLPDTAITLADYIDVQQLLIAADEALNGNPRTALVFIDSDQRKLFWSHVHGFVLGLQSPELAKVYCEGCQLSA